MKRQFLIYSIFLLLLAGCGNISALLSTPEPVSTTTSTATPYTTSTAIAPPRVTPDGLRILRIWVPPQFAPSAETPAGAIFQERLDEFVARRPGLQIEVRVKAEAGTGGLLDALKTTRLAAPSVMPDLVALSRADLEAATVAGFLHPLEGLTTLHDDPDWYAYARQLAHLQNTAYGLPFAGDALTLIGYRYPLPSNWNELPEGSLLIFPAADPRALFTLSLYLSAGGTLQDSQGRPALDEAILTEVFSLYLSGIENGFISSQVANYENDEEVWTAFREQRGNLFVSWTSRYLAEQTLPLAFAPPPAYENSEYTLATGWSWALAGSNPENQLLAVELAEFLSDSNFLGDWSQATGYLPTRPTALLSWKDDREQSILIQIAESASLAPSEDLLLTVGPLFVKASLSVLSGEQLPAEAAQSITKQLK